MHTIEAYASLGGGPMGLDTFSTAGATAQPAVLLIHGGGWRAGERAHVHDMARLLASQGFIAVAVDYRKTEREEYRFPGAIADLRCAVRYLRANAPQLGIDPSRIGAVGFSAGGHLAALLATAPDAGQLDDQCPFTEESPRIQAAVSYYGPYDLTRRGDFVRRARRLIDQVLGGPNPTRARLASPAHHVDPTDPPILLIHGTHDRVVPISQAHLMARRLRQARVPHALLPVTRAGHGFTLLSAQEMFMPASCTTLRFLRESLAPPAADSPLR